VPTIVERRIKNWLGVLPPPNRRDDPDQEFEWLLTDAMYDHRRRQLSEIANRIADGDARGSLVKRITAMLANDG
jgi:hypothetical protein